MAPRLSEILPPQPEQPPYTEADILTGCPCGRLQRLVEAMVLEMDPDRTVYLCPALCDVPILIVTRYNGESEDVGYHFGDWLMRNPFDVIAFSPNGNAWSRMVASPLARE
jgi:hypothetical protein